MDTKNIEKIQVEDLITVYQKLKSHLMVRNFLYI